MPRLPAIGTRVRFIGRAPGVRAFGIGKPGHVHYLLGAAEAVLKAGGDGYPRHRCPDHGDAPECVCGDLDDGWIDEHLPWLVAEYPCACGAELLGRTVDVEGEGISWEVVGDAALQEAQLLWDRNHRRAGALGITGPRPVGGGRDAD